MAATFSVFLLFSTSFLMPVGCTIFSECHVSISASLPSEMQSVDFVYNVRAVLSLHLDVLVYPDDVAYNRYDQCDR